MDAKAKSDPVFFGNAYSQTKLADKTLEEEQLEFAEKQRKML